MTIEAGLEAIAKMGEGLIKAVNENTENPGMIAVVERLIKALDRNTNTMLHVHGFEATQPETEPPKTDAGELPANLKRNKTENKPAATKSTAKPAAAKIEYATLQQKGLDVIAKFGKEHFVAWLGERALSNLKQAHVDDYPQLVADLDAELAKEVEEELT